MRGQAITKNIHPVNGSPQLVAVCSGNPTGGLDGMVYDSQIILRLVDTAHDGVDLLRRHVEAALVRGDTIAKTVHLGYGSPQLVAISRGDPSGGLDGVVYLVHLLGHGKDMLGGLLELGTDLFFIIIQRVIGQGQLLDIQVTGKSQEKITGSVPYPRYLQRFKALIGWNRFFHIGSGSAETGGQDPLLGAMIFQG